MPAGDPIRLSRLMAEPIFEPGRRVSTSTWEFLVMRKTGQRGEGRVGFIITLVVVIAGLFVGLKIIPVRINAYQLQDTLREEARFASVNHNNDSEVKQRILDQAESLNIPLDPKNVTIKRTKKEVIVRAQYVQPIDLKVTIYNYRFDEEQRAPVF
jgi:hypothetical protein